MTNDAQNTASTGGPFVFPPVHGLTVVRPGGHQCQVRTATNDDADTIRDMVPSIDPAQRAGARDGQHQ